MEQKTMRSSSAGKDAFTLIELMVVVGIIALLAALVLPVLNVMSKKGMVQEASANVRGIVMAWKSYKNEYGNWPVTSAGRLFGNLSGSQIAQEASSDGLLMNAVVMNHIMYPNSSEYGLGSGADNNSVCLTYNPKRITFMAYNQGYLNTAGDFVDPWDRPYRFLFDLDDNGRVTRAGLNATSVYDEVIVWSLGPDELDPSDDIRSWE